MSCTFFFFFWFPLLFRSSTMKGKYHACLLACLPGRMLTIIPRKTMTTCHWYSDPLNHQLPNRSRLHTLRTRSKISDSPQPPPLPPIPISTFTPLLPSHQLTQNQSKSRSLHRPHRRAHSQPTGPLLVTRPESRLGAQIHRLVRLGPPLPQFNDNIGVSAILARD